MSWRAGFLPLRRFAGVTQQVAAPHRYPVADAAEAEAHSWAARGELER
jgi:hypothetical protein